MPRSEFPFAEELTAVGEGAPSLSQKAELLKSIRERSPQMAEMADQFILDQVGRLRSGLTEAGRNLRQLEQLVGELTATPWHPAIFLRPVDTQDGPRAQVMCGNTRRVVRIANGVDPASLQIGDEVYLSGELNSIVAKSSYGAPRFGETGQFARMLDDGRMALRWREEEMIVETAGALADVEWQAGDVVLWERNALMAFERLNRAEHEEFFLREVEDLGRDCVGGQDVNLEAVLDALTMALVAPEKANRYEIGSKKSILLCGPPGCGKTLIARVAAAEVARLSGARCRFGVVKPGEWENPYVGVTQQNIRNCFRALDKAAEHGFATLFLDEIEGVGRIRGSSVGLHSDKSLDALLAELDGFQDRKNVAIIAASNRKDLIDPALLERLSDIEVRVDRPNLAGAQAILDIHLPPSVPYSPNGSVAQETRRGLIELAVSLLYDPNADNELCVLKFRDGRTRRVAARDLASGRMLEQICRAARQRAFSRDVRGGAQGLREEDMEFAVRQALDRATTTLTPRNAHAYLSDLPQDVDVVAVTPIARRSEVSRQYLNIDIGE